jgi:Family of unknown function (DUF6481)
MKDTSFSERLSAAKSARQAMVSRFLQRPGPDDPTVAERRAARMAVSAARELRLAEREAAQIVEETRLAAERAKQAAAAAAAEVAEREHAAAEKATGEAARELMLKAARDARYAARKARK